MSVIIPAFNAADDIENAIGYVARQTFTDFEVIVVDDASTDETAARARDILGRNRLAHTVVRLPVNAGPSAARNMGVSLARGEYVAFLDSDDQWLPGKLASQVRIMDENPGVTLCGCQADLIDDRGEFIEPLFTNLPSFLPDGWKILLWNCYIATPCAIARRKDLGDHPFDSSLRVGEDRDLWIRLASKGTVALVQDVMARIKVSPDSYMRRNTDAV
ncbi:MAG: glycosyltransferase family 2 protein, partial [Alphaproteobacteria bacterium]